MSHYEQEFQSSPDYVLNFIRWISNPYTPFINMQVDGVSSPFDHIHFSTLTNFYRFFDVLAYRKIFSNDVLILFINNVLKYGYDYALSITLNPLIEVMVDLDKKCLKKKFIDKLGHDLYARMLEKIGNDHQLLSSQDRATFFL